MSNYNQHTNHSTHPTLRSPHHLPPGDYLIDSRLSDHTQHPFIDQGLADQLYDGTTDQNATSAQFPHHSPSQLHNYPHPDCVYPQPMNCSPNGHDARNYHPYDQDNGFPPDHPTTGSGFAAPMGTPFPPYHPPQDYPISHSTLELLKKAFLQKFTAFQTTQDDLQMELDYYKSMYSRQKTVSDMLISSQLPQLYHNNRSHLALPAPAATTPPETARSQAATLYELQSLLLQLSSQVTSALHQYTTKKHHLALFCFLFSYFSSGPYPISTNQLCATPQLLQHPRLSQYPSIFTHLKPTLLQKINTMASMQLYSQITSSSHHNLAHTSNGPPNNPQKRARSFELDSDHCLDSTSAPHSQLHSQFHQLTSPTSAYSAAPGDPNAYVRLDQPHHRPALVSRGQINPDDAWNSHLSPTMSINDLQPTTTTPFTSLHHIVPLLRGTLSSNTLFSTLYRSSFAAVNGIDLGEHHHLNSYHQHNHHPNNHHDHFSPYGSTRSALNYQPISSTPAPTTRSQDLATLLSTCLTIVHNVAIQILDHFNSTTQQNLHPTAPPAPPPLQLHNTLHCTDLDPFSSHSSSIDHHHHHLPLNNITPDAQYYHHQFFNEIAAFYTHFESSNQSLLSLLHTLAISSPIIATTLMSTLINFCQTKVKPTQSFEPQQERDVPIRAIRDHHRHNDPHNLHRYHGQDHPVAQLPPPPSDGSMTDQVHITTEATSPPPGLPATLPLASTTIPNNLATPNPGPHPSPQRSQPPNPTQALPASSSPPNHPQPPQPQAQLNTATSIYTHDEINLVLDSIHLCDQFPLHQPPHQPSQHSPLGTQSSDGSEHSGNSTEDHSFHHDSSQHHPHHIFDPFEGLDLFDDLVHVCNMPQSQHNQHGLDVDVGADVGADANFVLDGANLDADAAQPSNQSGSTAESALAHHMDDDLNDESDPSPHTADEHGEVQCGDEGTNACNNHNDNDDHFTQEFDIFAPAPAMQNPPSRQSHNPSLPPPQRRPQEHHHGHDLVHHIHPHPHSLLPTITLTDSTLIPWLCLSIDTICTSFHTLLQTESLSSHLSFIPLLTIQFQINAVPNAVVTNTTASPHHHTHHPAHNPHNGFHGYDGYTDHHHSSNYNPDPLSTSTITPLDPLLHSCLQFNSTTPLHLLAHDTTMSDSTAPTSTSTSTTPHLIDDPSQWLTSTTLTTFYNNNTFTSEQRHPQPQSRTNTTLRRFNRGSLRRPQQQEFQLPPPTVHLFNFAALTPTTMLAAMTTLSHNLAALHSSLQPSPLPLHDHTPFSLSHAPTLLSTLFSGSFGSHYCPNATTPAPTTPLTLDFFHSLHHSANLPTTTPAPHVPTHVSRRHHLFGLDNSISTSYLLLHLLSHFSNIQALLHHHTTQHDLIPLSHDAHPAQFRSEPDPWLSSF